MEIYQLEQFIAVVEEGSMSEAADRLFLSRAAVSQGIKRLELELGCELFVRRHNRIEITPYGQVLHEHAREVLREIAEAKDGIESMKRMRQMVLRVGHFCMPLCYFKLPHLAHSLPDFTFDVDICEEQVACQGLLDGLYDFVMVTSKASLPPRVRKLDLEYEQACLSVPPGSSLYDRKSVCLSEIADEGILVADNMIGATDWYRELLSRTRLDPSTVRTVSSAEYLHTMTDSPLCHFSTTQMVNFFGLGNERRSVPIEDDIAKREIVVAYLPERYEAIAPVLESLLGNRRESVDNYDIFPYLIFPGEVRNLQMDIID